MVRPAALLLALVLSAALAGCSVRRPQVALANVQLGSVALGGPALHILLDIHNPNNWSIDLQELTYEVSIDDVRVGAGATTTRIVVPGGECATVELPVEVTWRGIGRGARDVLDGEIEYRVAGQLTVGTRVGTVRWPYDRRSRFSPLKGRQGGGRLCAEGRPS